METVRNVSLDDVTDVAEKVIKPNNMTWVVVGDRSQIESKIRELELGEIVLMDVDGNVVSDPATD